MSQNQSLITCGGIRCIFNCCNKLGECANSTSECFSSSTSSSSLSSSSSDLPTSIIILTFIASVLFLVCICICIYKIRRDQQRNLQMHNQNNGQDMPAVNGMENPRQMSERRLNGAIGGGLAAGLGYMAGLQVGNVMF